MQLILHLFQDTAGGWWFFVPNSRATARHKMQTLL